MKADNFTEIEPIDDQSTYRKSGKKARVRIFSARVRKSKLWISLTIQSLNHEVEAGNPLLRVAAPSGQDRGMLFPVGGRRARTAFGR